MVNRYRFTVKGKVISWSYRRCLRCKKFCNTKNKYCKCCAILAHKNQVKESNKVEVVIRKYNDRILREVIGLPIPFQIRENLRIMGSR
jgi:hypothetical protein